MAGVGGLVVYAFLLSLGYCLGIFLAGVFGNDSRLVKFCGWVGLGIMAYVCRDLVKNLF